MRSLEPTHSTTPAPTARDTEARETFAALAHEMWSGWMRYMFKRGAFRVDEFDNVSQTVWVMPGYLRERWERQMKTPYADLPEGEKESDRAEADRMIAIASAALAERERETMERTQAVVDAAIPIARLAEVFDKKRGGGQPSEDSHGVYKWIIETGEYELTVGMLRELRSAVANIRADAARRETP